MPSLKHQTLIKSITFPDMYDFLIRCLSRSNNLSTVIYNREFLSVFQKDVCKHPFPANTAQLHLTRFMHSHHQLAMTKTHQHRHLRQQIQGQRLHHAIVGLPNLHSLRVFSL